MASRFNVAKSDILGEDNDASSSTNPAVKLALAETHVIQETRKYLIAQGIHLGAFSPDGGAAQHKSPTTLLIKNIPYGTSDSALRDMFATHGNIVRLLIPPSGTIAVIDYDDASGADSAIKHLCYRRLGNSIMYIERAPAGVWSEKGAPIQEEDAARVVGGPKVVTISSASLLEAEKSAPPGTTLYVKNLSFNTTTDALVRAFQNLPSFAFARVATKSNPKQADAKLSMGFGFVGFQSVEAAQKGLKSMDGFVLDGHKLVVNFAGRGTEKDAGEASEKKGISKSKTTKMLVKNVPFEASKKDIRQLFGYVYQVTDPFSALMILS